MGRVVLVAINAKYVHSSLAAWVLAGGVSTYARLPHDVSVVEASINQPDIEIARRVADCRPDVVGISTYIWNARKLPGLLKLLREQIQDAVFVLGGPEVSFNADYWLGQGADYVICGEGEISFPELLDGLERGDGWTQGGGAASFARECSGAAPLRPIDPYSDTYFAALGGRIAYLETSRGCPYQCAFCLSAGSGVRFFPLDTVKRQLRRLSESGTHTIKLVDRTFNCNAARAYELFEYVIKLDTTCCFHFEVAADLFDERTLELLGSAPPGRIQLEAGLQSFFEPALNAVSRHTDTDKAKRNIRALLRKGNIHVHVDLIAGLPFEALPDFVESFDQAYSLGAHTLQLGFLKLLHGSKLRSQAGEFGIIYSQEPPYEIISSPWLSVDDMRILKQVENALQHTYNKCRFLSMLEYVLSASKLRTFELFRLLGEAAPNHGIQLEDYALQVYNFCAGLPGVDKNELRDRMLYDWLGMVKGKNMPDFLKSSGNRRKQVLEIARKQLGHKPGRYETAVLLSGKGIYVDSGDRDPVTGLYRVCSYN